MATLVPDATTGTAGPGWLEPFLAGWQTGSGEPYEVREPATGRPLLTMNLSTPEDVRRATKRARAAQASWADASYQDRARILRRAAEIYEAFRRCNLDRTLFEGRHLVRLAQLRYLMDTAQVTSELRWSDAAAARA